MRERGREKDAAEEKNALFILIFFRWRDGYGISSGFPRTRVAIHRLQQQHP